MYICISKFRIVGPAVLCSTRREGKPYNWTKDSVGDGSVNSRKKIRWIGAHTADSARSCRRRVRTLRSGGGTHCHKQITKYVHVGPRHWGPFSIKRPLIVPCTN